MAAALLLLGILFVFSGLFLTQDRGIILVFVLLLGIVIWRPEGLVGQRRVRPTASKAT